jgi:Putative prokaryotic signal transducing protein
MPPQQQANWEELTVIATVSGIMTAEILKSKLEDAGIRALLRYESVSILYGLTTPGLDLSRVDVLVAKPDAEQALQVLSTPPAPGWEDAAESLDDSQQEEPPC